MLARFTPSRLLLVILVLISAITLFFEYCKPADQQVKQDDVKASYVGDAKCQSCHAKEFASWQTSDHYKAMLPANDTTVLGDFNDVQFSADGVQSRFFKKEGKYFINTLGPDGENHDYEVLYTFGHKPLQQYLVAFPGGRMQVPRVSWDVNKEKWFHQYAGQKINHRDWLHWTGGGQNWNTMCASCHSTNLEKNYFAEADSFHTTWSAINVSCESCHGPASKHVEFMAEEYKPGMKPLQTFLYKIDSPHTAQVDACAPCHARKADISADLFKPGALMDYHIPEIPTTEFFHADGQVNEEDYIYTSFQQSKMFHRGVKCTNCHDPHSGKTLGVASQTCMQCHEKKYDSFEHHKHDEKNAQVAKQLSCINCHMPSKYYMGNDLRHDHSFRVPRPDLTVQYGTPNACNSCHNNKTAQWASDAVNKWYGTERKYHFADDLIAGSKQDMAAVPHLTRLLNDTAVPAIVQATAIQYLRDLPTASAFSTISAALRHEDAQVRYRAVRAMASFPIGQWRDQVLPLLKDKVKAVRIAAADVLLNQRAEEVPMEYRDAWAAAKQELQTYVNYQADFAVGNVLIGDYYYRQSDLLNAEKYYRRGLRKDSMMNYARFNLSALLNAQGRNADALKVLEDAQRTDPANERVYYNLALLYAELKDMPNAMKSFGKAVSLGSQDPRVYYNYGILKQQSGQMAEAEKLFLKGLEQVPMDAGLNYALAVLYLQQQQPSKAMLPATRLKKVDPGNPEYQRLFQQLRL
ncbi:MAG: tetratricopeptide repeat protein [Sphingobacteriales bacterium]